MKQIAKGLHNKFLLTFLMIAFLQTLAMAQDNASGSGSSTTTKSVTVTSQPNDWYSSPWVWFVGAAVFILLLVALLRGSSSNTATSTRTDRVTVTKSSATDDLA